MGLARRRQPEGSGQTDIYAGNVKVAHGAAHQNLISLLDGLGGQPRPFHFSNTGGVEINPVAVASLHHFGVPGDHLHPTGGGGVGQRGDDALQILHREALFQDHAQAQIAGHRPAQREVVDGAAHRQLADVPAGEEDGVNDKAVGGEGQGAGEIQQRPVPQGGQVGIAEGGEEQIFNELGGAASAAAVV